MANVKPGDMAIIVKATQGYQWTLGRPVKIARACCLSDRITAWRFVDALVHEGVAVKCAPDAFLKRIEPLTDDEKRQVAKDAELPAPPIVVHVLESMK